MRKLQSRHRDTRFATQKGYDILPEDSIKKFTDTARRIAEITNVRLPKNTPYVGKAAFMHKGGMHGDGVMKYSPAFEHIDPSVVGNERSFPISEVAGRAIFLKKRRTFSPTSPSIKSNPTPFSKTERNGNARLSV